MSRLLNGLRAKGAALGASRRGSIPILFGLALLPLVGMIGLAVDYGVATTNKTKLDTAADAAAIAGVVTAKAYLSENAGQANVSARALAAGSARAVAAFAVNTGTLAFGQVTLAPPQVTRSAQTLTAIVSYTATVKNTFGPIFGSPTTVFSNTVTASADIASYLDFYLMVDVSGSMGLPATDDGMKLLAKDNDDKNEEYLQGCQFACHFPGFKGWTLAAEKIQLRSDAVNNAVCSLILRAAAPLVPNQYRIGIYPFINQLATLASLTSNISSLSTAAQCGLRWPLAFTNLLDTGTTQLAVGSDPSTGTGSGGTHFEVSLPQMKATIARFGKGSSTTDTKPFVFLVTDGMQNFQNYFTNKNGRYTYPGRPSNFKGYADAWWDKSQPSLMNPSDCTPLKTAGATVSILYIPYNQINFENNSLYIASENNKANALSPDIAETLKSCASPGFFYTANAPADITASLNAMFDQALRVARLTP